MRILVDTNILIPLEDPSANFTCQLAELNRLMSGKHALLFHPGTCDDIRRDKDPARQAMMLQRLSKYNSLDTPPELSSDEEIDLFGAPRKDNDRVDNLILYALHRNCVHWLITEDSGLHKKARNIGQSDRVLRVEQALVALRTQEPDSSRLHPHLDDLPCHAIDLPNPFFDSLRAGYGGFDQWFVGKCSKEGRRAWVCHSEGTIHSLCIYKPEQDEVVTNDHQRLKGKSLKLCTFKVETQGYKLGELMLKQAFGYAVKNNLEYVYATVEPDQHTFLESLLQDFGFEPIGTDVAGRDLVYVKYFPVELPVTTDSNLDYAIKYYPGFRLNGNTGYLVPIKPQYHQILFPEAQRQDDLFTAISNSAGNSIKQAYLCKANCKSIAPGDVLFFYRTQDEMAITTYGIVDHFMVESDAEEIYQWVAKRTVYSYDEIEDMSGSQVKVILFRLVGHLDQPITYKQLQQLGVVKGPIQSITSLSNDNTKTIIREARINDCLISD